MKAEQDSIKELVDQQRAMIEILTQTDEEHKALIEQLTGENRTLIDQLTEESRLLSEENGLRKEEQLVQDELISGLDTDVLALNDEQVVEDHFFSNQERIRLFAKNLDMCTEQFEVPAGMTLDFNGRANMTHLQVIDNKKVMGRIFLVKNDTDRVAQHWFATREAWDFPGGALTYREKLEEESASYRFCFTWAGNHDEGMQPQFNPGMFQWGYKILGQEY